MRKLLIVLLILGVVLAAFVGGLSYLDARAREFAEAEAQTRLAAELPRGADPKLEIKAFPFVGGVLLDGTVEHLTVSIAELSSQGVTVHDLKIEIETLELDRDLLLDEKKLRVLGIEKAHISGLIDGKALKRYAPVPVTLSDGVLTAKYQGKSYTGTVSVSKHAIVVTVKGMPPMLVPLPEQDYLPCEPTIALEGDHIAVECTLDELPPAVAEVLGKV